NVRFHSSRGFCNCAWLSHAATPPSAAIVPRAPETILGTMKEADEASAKACRDILDAAEKGAVNAVRHFLRVVPDSIGVTDHEGKTALHVAVEKGQVAVTKLLVFSDAAVETKDHFGETALHLHARRSTGRSDGGAAGASASTVEVFQVLRAAGASVDAQNHFRRTALHLAAQFEHPEMAQLLLEAKADLEAQDHRGRTPLHLAVQFGHSNIVQQLLNAKANVHAEDDTGASVVRLAQCGVDLAEVLGAAGAKADAAEAHRCRDMAQAVEKAKLGALRHFLHCRPQEVMKADSLGRTLLHGAATRGSAKVLQLLLDAAALVDAKDVCGDTALHWAVQFGQIEAARQLLAAGASDVENNRGCRPLEFAVEKEDLKAAEALLASKANLHTSCSNNRTGQTLLQMAKEKNPQFAEDLLQISERPGAEQEADEVEAKACRDLFDAVRKGAVPAVRHLLRAGEEIGRTDKEGTTPLHLAARHGHVVVARQLLAAHAEVSAQNSYGETSLHLAAQQGHVGAVQLLLHFKAMVDEKTGSNTPTNGSTALHFAAQRGHGAAVAALLAARAVLEAPNVYGCLPLHLAAQQGNCDTARRLLEAAAAVNATTEKDGEVALHFAAKEKHCELLRLLVTAGASLNAQSRRGETPLHLVFPNAATEPSSPRRRRGSASVAQLLVAARADVDAKNSQGQSVKELAHAKGLAAFLSASLA
ncbi:unnamed protein product, partial [Durusdinium trenchii]